MHSGLERFERIFYILSLRLILVIGLVVGYHNLPFDFIIQLFWRNQTKTTVPRLVDALSLSNGREKEGRTLKLSSVC